MKKRLAWLTTVVLATLMGVAVVWEFRGAAILFVISLGIAAAVRPAIDHLIKRGLPRGLALLVTYGLSLSLLAILLFAISSALLHEIQQAADRLAVLYERMTVSWPQGSPFQQAVAEQLPAPSKLYDAMTAGQGEPLAGAVLGVTNSLLDLGSNLIIIVALSVYWGSGHQRFERLWLSLLPVEMRARARDVWQEIETGVGAYIRSELVQGLLAALLLGLGFWAIGLRYPTLLALWGALAWLIPWLGVLLAVVPALLVGLSQGPLFGAAAATYTFAVLLILEVWVEPRLFNRRRYSSMLIMLVVIALADAFGVIGIVAAPPLAAAIQIFFSRVLYRQAPSLANSPAFRGSDFQDRLAALRVMVAGMAQPQPEIENMLARLDKLLLETGDYLPENIPITTVSPSGQGGQELALGTGEASS